MIVIKEVNKKNILFKIVDLPYPTDNGIGHYKSHVKYGEVKNLGGLILEKEYELDIDKHFIRDHNGFWIPNSAFTCYHYLSQPDCKLAYDLYNQDGDCLAVK